MTKVISLKVRDFQVASDMSASNPLSNEVGEEASNLPDETITREEWHPTEEELYNFIRHDEFYATKNIRSLLHSKTSGMTLKELRECSLHSVDALSRALMAGIRNGSIEESRGRYSLR